MLLVLLHAPATTANKHPAHTCLVVLQAQGAKDGPKDALLSFAAMSVMLWFGVMSCWLHAETGAKAD